MKNEKTGGPAIEKTLLDDFAGLAMQSIIANRGSIERTEEVSQSAYRFAAAMIAERNRILSKK